VATIRKREGKLGISYDVQIRIRPYPPTNQSFKKLTEAKRWAEKTEMDMREGRYGCISESRKKTLSDAIERYRKYVLPNVQKKQEGAHSRLVARKNKASIAQRNHSRRHYRNKRQTYSFRNRW